MARLTWQVPLDPAVLTGSIGGQIIGQVCYDAAADELRSRLSRELARMTIPASVDAVLDWEEAGQAKSAGKSGIYEGETWLIEMHAKDPGEVRRGG